MHDIQLNPIGLFILGATALAFMYHAILFYFNKDKLLIHYLIYLFFTGVFTYSKSGLITAAFGDRVYAYTMYYFLEAIQIIYLTAYFNFIVEAIGISDRRKLFLFRYWRFITIALIVYAVLHALAKIFLPYEDYPVAFTIVRILIFGMTAIMLYQSYKLREIKFQLLILIGCTIYFIFGIVSFVTNILKDTNDFMVYPLEWLMIGSFIDIIFFSVAIGYKNKKEYQALNVTLLKEANKHIALQSVLLEKQSELENERKRIAADMHDDLGSGLTKITYLSQMALKSDTENNLQKIKTTASELVGNMSELIWVMKEENNTLEDLATYIKSYAVNYFEINNIDLKVRMPEDFNEALISGNDRRNLFLSVKECLHNIVKHARATSVLIEITVENQLKICIEDDGIGISAEPQTGALNGNGLRNMKSRIESMNGNFLISNHNGTKVCFMIPLKSVN